MPCRPIMPARTWCWSTPAASSIRRRRKSLEAIGEAIAENGRVIVTGCFGKEAELIRARFPNVLAVTGAHQYEEVVGAVHEAAPMPPNAFLNLVPEAGLKLTPRHYSYLKISEGCNHRCAFCNHPQPARRPGQPPARRDPARGREAGRGGDTGAARHQPGHVGIRRRHPQGAADCGRAAKSSPT